MNSRFQYGSTFTARQATSISAQRNTRRPSLVMPVPRTFFPLYSYPGISPELLVMAFGHIGDCY